MIKSAFPALLLVAACAAAQNPDWHRPFPPFRIAGNLYYVGTADLAEYLVHTPQGNILINQNFPQDVPALKKSIESLGFRYEDTVDLLMSHDHDDHDGAAAIVQRETHGRLMVMAEDAPGVESKTAGHPGAHVDRVLHDGDTVELGGTRLVAHLTPGHTKGCTTWTMQVNEGGRLLNVVIVGSPNVNPGYILVGNKDYPRIAEDYVRTFEALRALPCDIFLGAHGAYFGMLVKYAKFQAGDTSAFIDPAGYKAWIAEREQAFRTEWARQQRNPAK